MYFYAYDLYIDNTGIVTNNASTLLHNSTIEYDRFYKTTHALTAKNYDTLLQTAIKRHKTIFRRPKIIKYSRIVVRHWDGSCFDVHGAVYEYVILDTVSEIASIPKWKQKMLIVYPGHHPVLLFFVGDLQFVDVYPKLEVRKRIYDGKDDYEEDHQYAFMDSIAYSSTGIKNVWLWIGPHAKGLRALVGKPRAGFKERFELTVPEFNIFGKVNIPLKTLEKVKKWILQNLDAIKKYSKGEIWCDEFLDLLKPIDESK